MTFPAEAFYRAATRASVDETTLPPFNLKLTKVPTLSSWLVTLSPNTANEEIVYYASKDDTNKTINITKRGINWSSQALTTGGAGAATGDYDNSLYMKKHSQWDNVQCDITHLHLIQDYGDLQAQINTKLPTAGWTRTWLAANAIMRTNGSWVESADVIDSITPIDTDTILMQRAWTISETPYSQIKSDIATVAGWAITFPSYESGIVSWDAVGNVNGMLIKCVTENASSMNLNAWTIVAPSQVALDNTRILFVYSLSNVVKAVVWTLSWNSVSLWTSVDIFTWSAIIDTSCALIWTDKVAIMYWESTAWALIRTKVVTIAGTVITQWAEYSQSLNSGYVGNYNLNDLEVIKLRTDAFVWNIRNTSLSWNYVRAFTVSWTTITAGTVYADYIPTDAGSWVDWGSQMAYLSDNKIAFNCQWGSLATAWPTTNGIYIWNINPANTSISSTQTVNMGVTQNAYLARYDNNQVIFSYVGANTFVYLFNGTAATPLIDNWGGNFFPVFSIMDNVFATYNNGTISIYQNNLLIRTIASWINLVSTPTKLFHINQYFQLLTGRLIYVSWNNGTTRIVNLAITFYLWLASNSTWWVIFRWVQTRTAQNWIKFYLQTDWTIGVINTSILVWRWLWTSLIIW